MHSRLLKIMTELGYSPNQNGICYGVASMAAQAALVDELNVFFDRLKKIENLTAPQLSQFIQQLKSSDLAKLTPQKKEQAVDMLAFFDGVKTHAEISNVSYLFCESGREKAIQQEFVISAKQVGSLLLEKENICKVTEFILGLTRKELEHYLQQLKYLCDERKALKLTFMLSANGHTIEMSYDQKTKKIIIVDANQLENNGQYQQVQTKQDDIDVAVDMLFKGFLLENTDTLLLTTAVYTNKNNSERNQKLIHDWYIMINNFISWDTKFDVVDRQGRSLLCLAAEYGHFALVKNLIEIKTLIAKGVDVDAADYVGVTPLYIAAENGHLEVVKLLLLNGANINAPNNNGVTPILVAAQNGYLEVVKWLLFYGANINAPNNNGVTPLYIAAQNGHLEVLKLLLLNGANVNAATHNGSTPLYVAAENGHLPVIKILCEHGATIQPVDFSNHNLLTSSYQNKLIDLKKESPYLLPVTDETRLFPCIVINVSMIVVLEKHLQTLQPDQVGIKNVIRGLIGLIYQHIHQPFHHAVSLQRLRSGYHYVNNATFIDELVSYTRQFQACQKPDNTTTVTTNANSFSAFTFKKMS